MTPDVHDQDDLLFLLRQGYDAPSPSSGFAQALGDRLEQELCARRKWNGIASRDISWSQRQWFILALAAIAATLLAVIDLMLLTNDRSAKQTPDPPAIVRDPPKDADRTPAPTTTDQAPTLSKDTRAKEVERLKKSKETR